MGKFISGLIVGIGICGIVGGVIGFYTLGQKATVEAPDWESYVIKHLKNLRIPEAGPPASPFEITDAYLLQEAEHYNHHCAVCHDLEGDADSAFAKAFYPPVSDLTSERVQNYSDRQLKWIVEYGIRYTGMPGWENIIDEENQWKIINYMRVFAGPAQAEKFEELLKEQGKWKVGSPGEHEHHHGDKLEDVSYPSDEAKHHDHSAHQHEH